MTKAEFFEQRAKLAEKYDRELLNLERKFAKEHTRVRIGDVISDGNNTIVVDKFLLKRVSKFGNGFLPYCNYHGVLPDGSSVTIYQDCLQTINGKEVSYE